jgi:hypothetical protein
MASTYVRDAPSVKEEEGGLGAVPGPRPRPFRVLSLDGGGSASPSGSPAPIQGPPRLGLAVRAIDTS